MKEFMETGLLQEANRLFFHPLGMSLFIEQDVESKECIFKGLIDDRHRLEGFKISKENRHEALGKKKEENTELVLAIKSEDKNKIREEALDVAESCMYLIASTIAKTKAKKKKAKKVKKLES